MTFTANLSMSERSSLLEQLGTRGLLEGCAQVIRLPSLERDLGERGLEVTVSGDMRVGAHLFRLQVRLPLEFPLCLPVVHLMEVTPPIVIPHLVEERRICFTSDANLLDQKDPWGILQESLGMVREHLVRMLKEASSQDFLREAVAYWGKLSKGETIDCAVTAGGKVSQVTAFYAGARLYAVADDASTYAQSLPERRIRELSQRKAIYLPLDPGAVEFAFWPGELAKAGGLWKYVRAMPEGECRALVGCLERCAGDEHLVVIGLHRPDEERALVGIQFSNIRRGHPLLDQQAEARITPISMRRRDLAFLAPRGGAGIQLRDRRVLIAGCGAVGGYVALALARAGVGHLSLVDPDLFSLENTYRHACGMARCSEWKPSGLKAEIERTVPYVSVESKRARIERLIREQESWVQGHDLVLSALGHPTLELDLNEWTWGMPERPAALFTWLEPLGLGGHALLTHARSAEGPAPGCLECLYRRTFEGGPIENRAAFAASDVSYTRDTLGCGNRYLPFADLDAQRTAEQAARMALLLLRREAAGAPLVSWRGDRRAFESAGHRVTPRFEKGAGEFDYIRAGCPVCSG
ncbi:ThiF family adenylyltransferase [Corallococcus sp. Z5C101001]|uniref:ThiF family adenylyltransferase n=1 Tax=Corallococcus sp. Z5C101001 TaxID=2596829 RepID=UPI00118134BC|nr:ThiF family adenylyltransferase [Corallococcus sp. Z5C101001]TSC33933.1 hypothetical protein FOF48_02480 [Corallococcus sp. Z5C101001]